MPQRLRRYKGSHGEVGFLFWCPGCDDPHQVRVAGRPPVWDWNGNQAFPTFSPSVLVRADHRGGRCHFYVVDGALQFLSDCTHALAGQTVLIPDWPDSWYVAEPHED